MSVSVKTLQKGTKLLDFLSLGLQTIAFGEGYGQQASMVSGKNLHF